MAMQPKSVYPLLLGFAIVLFVTAIGMVIYSGQTGQQLYLTAVPLFAVGSALMAVATTLKRKK